MTPMFVFISLSDIIVTENRNFILVMLFLMIASTDALDGFIARRWNRITTFGIFMDPIADKILIISSMGLLVFLQRLHPFVLIILLWRDFLISGIKMIATESNVDVSAISTGKIKTIFEVMLVTFLLFNYEFPGNKIVLSILIVVTIVIAIVSFIQYIIKYWNAICTNWNKIKCSNKGIAKGVKSDGK